MAKRSLALIAGSVCVGAWKGEVQFKTHDVGTQMVHLYDCQHYMSSDTTYTMFFVPGECYLQRTETSAADNVTTYWSVVFACTNGKPEATVYQGSKTCSGGNSSSPKLPSACDSSRRLKAAGTRIPFSANDDEFSCEAATTKYVSVKSSSMDRKGCAAVGTFPYERAMHIPVKTPGCANTEGLGPFEMEETADGKIKVRVFEKDTATCDEIGNTVETGLLESGKCTDWAAAKKAHEAAETLKLTARNATSTTNRTREAGAVGGSHESFLALCTLLTVLGLA